MSLDRGTLLGPFEILSPLGVGGMGEVYRAKDTRLGREVAVKVLPKELLADRTRLVRFSQEARAASGLNHPNIVTIHEIGQAGELPFIAMEYVDGRTLRSLLGQGPLSVRTALGVGSQLADGLAKAHEAGIVHRDLKPENIMVTKDGYVKILDFGLAKLVDHSGTDVFATGMTATGFVLGTAGYMSPEQASAQPLDFRSDQFSVGLILYEMVTGRRAFDRGTPVQTLSAIIQEDPEPLQRLAPRVPPPFRWIIERCISKDREERYAATKDLARDMKQLRDNLHNLSEAGLSGAAPAPTAPAPVPSAQTPVVAESAAVTRVSHTVAVPEAVEAGRGDAAVPTKTRRVADFLNVLGLGIVLFAAGAAGGYWFRGKTAEPPAARFDGELLLGGSTKVMAPRVSPDGQTLAFVTIRDGVSQVAVMKPASGDWTVLTHQRGVGSVYRVVWSHDGGKLYFDRVTDVPHGIFSVPALGGEERLVLENAETPEALPDGTLLFVKADADRNLQAHRLWPDTGKVQPVGPPVVAESLGLNLRAFADGTEAIFWGKLASTAKDDNLRHAYLLDLAGGKVRRFAPELPLAPPVSVGADGRSVLAGMVSGDLHRIVSVSRDEKDARVLLSLIARASYLTAAPDGTLFVGTMDNSVELLRFPPAGGVPERLASIDNQVMNPVEFPNGRFLVSSLVAGRRRLMVTNPDGSLRPLVETADQAMAPATLVGDRQVAFLLGGLSQRPVVALASVDEGRIVRRLESTSGAAPQCLAVSPDGKTLYYVDAGQIFAVDVEGGPPRKLCAGDGLAVDGRRAELLVQLNDREGVHLVSVPYGGGPGQPVAYQSALRLAPRALWPGAVGRDGRVAVTVASKDSWFWGPALLDRATGAVERVPVVFEGDVQAATWGRDGSLLAMGVGMRSALWKFKAKPAEGR